VLSGAGHKPMSMLGIANAADVVTDGRGDVTLLLDTKRWLRCVVLGDSSFGIREIVPGATEVEVVARPVVEVAGTVVDSKARSLPGVTVASEPPKTAVSAESPVVFALFCSMRDRFVKQTDRRGRFRVWVLGKPKSVKLRLSVVGGSQVGATCEREVRLDGSSKSGVVVQCPFDRDDR